MLYFRVIEEEPERLAEVKGISEKKARAIAVEFSEKQEMRQAMMFLSGYGINNNLAVKIYKEYGDHLYTIIQENPYKMTDDIAGVGFKIADEIAKKVGIGSSSDYRIISGIFYTLMRALNEGHVFLPKRILCRNAAHILGVTPEDIEEHLLEMMIDRKIVIEEDEETRVYAAPQYHMEVNTARMLLDLNIHYDVSISEVETMIAMIEETEQITFAEKQKEAIHAVAQDSIVVLTGGPGTGKTTTINGMIQYFEHEGLDIRLAAPTGRAAKRMTEATGYEAMTIHRMLEINGEADRERDMKKGNASMFERNAGNPLETDVIIIDEMSMVILTGGELASLVVADSVLRLKPGVLAEQKGYEEESYWDGLLEYPQYTRPEVWEGRAVPEVLLGGDHAKIDAWRGEQSRTRTRLRRPELYEQWCTSHPIAEVPKWKRGENVRLVKTAEQFAAAAKLFAEGRQAVCADNWTPEYCRTLTELRPKMNAFSSPTS